MPAFIAKKHEIAKRYDEAFRDVPGIALPPRAAWADPTMWLYTIRLDAAKYGCDRRELLARLEKVKIQSRPIWSPLHGMPMYEKAQRLGSMAVAERLFEAALSLPCSTSLKDADQGRVIDVVRRRA